MVAEIPSKTTDWGNQKFRRKRPIREMRKISSKTTDRFNAQIFWIKKFRRKRQIDWTHSKGVFFIKSNHVLNSIESDRSGRSKFHKKRPLSFRANFPNNKKTIPEDDELHNKNSTKNDVCHKSFVFLKKMC